MIEIEFLTILILLSIIQGFLLGIVILCSKFFKSNTNQYLGYTILIVSISSLNNWFWELSTYPVLIDVLDLILWQFLFPVTLFLFFAKATKYTIHFHPIWLYLPFLCFTLFNVLISLETHYQLYQLPLTHKNLLFSLFYDAISIISVIYAILLSVFSGYFVVYNQLKKNSVVTQKWLKTLWGFITVQILLWSVFELMKVFLEKANTTIILVGCSFMIYWIIYKGLYQFKLANDQFEIQQIFKDRSKKKPATPSSKPLKKLQQSDYFEQVKVLLDQEKLYRNPDLGRNDIANRLGISSGYLSQIINRMSGHSFSELIHHYRVEETKLLLLDPEFRHYSVLAIGLEAGFKSKSNFYTAFKKHVGLTPGEYQKEKK